MVYTRSGGVIYRGLPCKHYNPFRRGSVTVEFKEDAKFNQFPIIIMKKKLAGKTDVVMPATVEMVAVAF